MLDRVSLCFAGLYGVVAVIQLWAATAVLPGERPGLAAFYLAMGVANVLIAITWLVVAMRR